MDAVSADRASPRPSPSRGPRPRAARRGSAPPMRHAVFPGGRAHPAAALPRGRRRLRRRRPGGLATPPRPRSSCCIAPRWCMTTCPASTTPPTRRGKPSVHRAFGEPLAVLTGDALIVLAFETLARGTARAPDRLAPLVMIVGRAVGAPHGIVAGQAWECEPRGRSRAATSAPRPARCSRRATRRRRGRGGRRRRPPGAPLGERLGEAYQVADDIRDAAGDPGGDRQAGRPRRGARPPERGPARSASTAPSPGWTTWSREAVDVASRLPRRSSCGPHRAQATAVCRRASPARRLSARSSRSTGMTGLPGRVRGGWRASGPFLADRWLRGPRPRCWPARASRHWAAALPADAADRAAARPGAVRPLRRLRLRADPARLRPAATSSRSLADGPRRARRARRRASDCRSRCAPHAC